MINFHVSFSNRLFIYDFLTRSWEFAIVVHLCRSRGWNRVINCLRDGHRRMPKKIQ